MPSSKSKPQIVFPVATPATPLPHAWGRLAHLLLDIVLTASCSFTVLLALLYLLGLVAGPASAAEFPDASPFGVLRVTIACTLGVYAAIEMGAVLLRRCRRDCQSDYEYDYKVLDADALHAEHEEGIRCRVEDALWDDTRAGTHGEWVKASPDDIFTVDRPDCRLPVSNC
ncbi:hypothetical protein C8F04DRAFT_1271685 [Mycena alexandri]|uniref:Uncharacterized protein n=1 Tax=Mycena alexandri TaxID=1745969 RepID=A0AAD6WTQ1_9AGAR|nr:hypothetical protein C8F04DRAFT_1271685 [Mycena alexandri]